MKYIKQNAFRNETFSFLFYDYETFGKNKFLDKPAQFACIRTDLNLNIIDNPQFFYCFPPNDYLPDPEAVLITGITPQYTQKYGTNECIFSQKIHKILTQPNTCIVGYNNISFDDEITRNIFYRNFFDPYEWSWKNSNSRFDLLNVLRVCYVLRPNGIKWPINKLGLPSFRLSDITKINNIYHCHAHDAVADVYATIKVAKLIKKKQPKLFLFCLKIRKKNELYKLLNVNFYQPLIYISSFFGADRNNFSYIMPIAFHKNNENILIAIDLFQKNISELIKYCQKKLHDNDIKYLFHLGVIILHLNRCPILAPIKSVRLEDINRLNLNLNLYHHNVFLLKNNFSILKNIQNILSKQNYVKNNTDVDLQIYNSFFNVYDKKLIKIVRNTKPIHLKTINLKFQDSRLKEIFFRYRARNFFCTLNIQEKKIWLYHCQNVFNKNFLMKYKFKINFLMKYYYGYENKIKLLNNLLSYLSHLIKKFS